MAIKQTDISSAVQRRLGTDPNNYRVDPSSYDQRRGQVVQSANDEEARQREALRSRLASQGIGDSGIVNAENRQLDYSTRMSAAQQSNAIDNDQFDKEFLAQQAEQTRGSSEKIAGMNNSSAENIANITGNFGLKGIDKQGQNQLANTSLEGKNQLAGIGAQGQNQLANTTLEGKNQLAGIGAQGQNQLANTALEGQNQLTGINAQGRNQLANTTLEGRNTLANTTLEGYNTLANTSLQGKNNLAGINAQGQNQLANTTLEGQNTLANTGLQGVNQMAGIYAQGQNTLANTALEGKNTLANTGLQGANALANTALSGANAKELEQVHGDVAATLYGIEHGYTQGDAASNAKALSYYDQGQAGKVIPDSELEALKNSDPTAYWSYQSGQAAMHLNNGSVYPNTPTTGGTSTGTTGQLSEKDLNPKGVAWVAQGGMGVKSYYDPDTGSYSKNPNPKYSQYYVVK
jgi:hypothetical protein